jgi:hypothetical protein
MPGKFERVCHGAAAEALRLAFLTECYGGRSRRAERALAYLTRREIRERRLAEHRAVEALCAGYWEAPMLTSRQLPC